MTNDEIRMTNNRLTMQELNPAKYIAAVFRDRKADQPTTQEVTFLPDLPKIRFFRLFCHFLPIY